MNIDWSSVLILVVCVASIVAVWFDEKVKDWRIKKASPFPLFKLTDEEGEVLVKIYNKPIWFVPWLCHEVLNQEGRDCSLLKKIREVIGDCSFLSTWMICHRGNCLVKGLSPADNTALRKQWIVALLKYNNMQEKLK